MFACATFAKSCPALSAHTPRRSTATLDSSSSATSSSSPPRIRRDRGPRLPVTRHDDEMDTTVSQTRHATLGFRRWPVRRRMFRRRDLAQLGHTLVEWRASRLSRDRTLTVRPRSSVELRSDVLEPRVVRMARPVVVHGTFVHRMFVSAPSRATSVSGQWLSTVEVRTSSFVSFIGDRRPTGGQSLMRWSSTDTVLHRVRAPRSPDVSALHERRRRGPRVRPRGNAEVGFGEGVGIAERSHGDHLSRHGRYRGSRKERSSRRRGHRPVQFEIATSQRLHECRERVAPFVASPVQRCATQSARKR